MKANHPLADYPEIRRKIALRSVRILLLSALWIGIVTFVEMQFLYQYFVTHSVPPIAAAVIWLVLYLIGVWKIGLFPWLFDTSWEGDVVKVKYRSYITSNGALMLNRCAVYEQTDEHLTIHMQKGKLRYTVTRQKDLDAVIYKEGDLVRHYRGTPYPLILARDGAPAPRICVFCSDVQPYPDRTHCDHCGMSLIEIRKKTP